MASRDRASSSFPSVSIPRAELALGREWKEHPSDRRFGSSIGSQLLVCRPGTALFEKCDLIRHVKLKIDINHFLARFISRIPRRLYNGVAFEGLATVLLFVGVFLNQGLTEDKLYAYRGFKE